MVINSAVAVVLNYCMSLVFFPRGKLVAVTSDLVAMVTSNTLAVRTLGSVAAESNDAVSV